MRKSVEGKNNPNWRGGHTLQKIKCKYCDKIINARNKTKSCRSCRARHENPSTDPKVARKIGLKLRGKKKSEESIRKLKETIKRNGGRSGKKNSHYKDGRSLNVACVDCGKARHYKSSPTKPARCRKCYTKYLSKIMSGSGNTMFRHKYSEKTINLMRRNNALHGNPNWLDGKSFEPYSYEFNREIKEKIRSRDNYTCTVCGMTEEEHISVYGQVLHVHHVDYNKKNSKETNLASTCCGCNFRANYNRDRWKEFFTNKIMEIYKAQES